MKKDDMVVFIDFDDTIYDTRNNAELSLREMFLHYDLGRYFPSYEDFSSDYWQTNHSLWGQYSREEVTRDYLIVERFRRPLSKGMDVTEEFCLEVSDYFLERNCLKGGLVEGARQLVDYLRSRYPLYVASNGFTEVQSRKIASAGLDGCFDGLVLSEAAGVNKPSPLFFDYAMKQAGCTSDNCIMIGDNYDTDILGAMNANIRQIYFHRSPEKPVPSPTPTHVVTCLKEVMDIL